MVLRSKFLLPGYVLVHLVIVANAITEAGFKTILDGRCEEYQNIFYEIEPKKDCKAASTSFLNIFNVKSAACNRASYEKFIKSVQHPVPHNKGLLWSGVPPLVEQISLLGKRFMPIMYTLTGYMLDDIKICGGVMNDSEGCKNCQPKDAKRAFWGMASEYYAKSLNGPVVILLSARRSSGTASIFYNKSILATTEIPNLSTAVTSLEAWPIQSLNGTLTDPIKDICSETSMVKLKNILEGKGYKYKCKEMGRIPIFAMCLNEPQLCSAPTLIGEKQELFFLVYIVAIAVTLALRSGR